MTHRFMIVVAFVCIAVAGSISQTETARASPLAPLSSEDQIVVQRIVSADKRIRELVGEGPQRIAASDLAPDKQQAELFLGGESKEVPSRRVLVVIYNPRTNRAAQAAIDLNNNTVVAAERVNPSSVPLSREDVVDAFALAKQNPEARKLLGERIERFQVPVDQGNVSEPFIVQALPLRSVAGRDSCHVDRCLELIFRTDRGYLPGRVRVDLTNRSVTTLGRDASTMRQTLHLIPTPGRLPPTPPLVGARSIPTSALAHPLNQNLLLAFCPNVVDQKFPTSGPELTHWIICWREVSGGYASNPNGLVIGPVFFRKSPSAPYVSILWEMRISEFFVPYHPGTPGPYYDLSGFGFSLTDVNTNDCPSSIGGKVLSAHVCQEVRDRGLLWKDWSGVRRGEEVVLWGAINAANYRYVEEYSFRDDGVIIGRSGATGQNLPGAEHVAHVHNPIWRIDIDLNGTTNSVNHVTHVENVAAGTANDVTSPIATAMGFGWNPQRFDALEVTSPTLSNAQNTNSSYEFIPLPVGGLTRHQEDFTQNDFWVTPYNSAQFAAKDLPTYVASHPSVVNTDIVVWYKGSIHHHPSDEDGVYASGIWSGTALMHWTGFMMVPNNFFDCSPFFHSTCP